MGAGPPSSASGGGRRFPAAAPGIGNGLGNGLGGRAAGATAGASAAATGGGGEGGGSLGSWRPLKLRFVLKGPEDCWYRGTDMVRKRINGFKHLVSEVGRFINLELGGRNQSRSSAVISNHGHEWGTSPDLPQPTRRLRFPRLKAYTSLIFERLERESSPFFRRGSNQINTDACLVVEELVIHLNELSPMQKTRRR